MQTIPSAFGNFVGVIAVKLGIADAVNAYRDVTDPPPPPPTTTFNERFSTIMAALGPAMQAMLQTLRGSGETFQTTYAPPPAVYAPSAAPGTDKSFSLSLRKSTLLDKYNVIASVGDDIRCELVVEEDLGQLLEDIGRTLRLVGPEEALRVVGVDLGATPVGDASCPGGTCEAPQPPVAPPVPPTAG